MMLNSNDPLYKRSLNQRQLWKVEKLNDLESGANCFKEQVSAIRSFLVE